eukprot:9536510-Karenia_brevis.AAC.1
MTEYTKADGTLGYVNYDDDITRDSPDHGKYAEYYIPDPTWRDNRKKRTVKGYEVTGYQNGFCAFTRYQSFCMERDHDI